MIFSLPPSQVREARQPARWGFSVRKKVALLQASAAARGSRAQ
jgi:hypothetical protein